MGAGPPAHAGRTPRHPPGARCADRGRVPHPARGARPKVLPESRLGKAVAYALGQWPKPSVFLTHGEVPLTNNRCENAIWPFVVGRKGWLFKDTVPGAVASANLYSLVETAKANGLEPFAYFSRLFGRLPQLKTVEDFEAVLPWNVKNPASIQ